MPGAGAHDVIAPGTPVLLVAHQMPDLISGHLGPGRGRRSWARARRRQGLERGAPVLPRHRRSEPFPHEGRDLRCERCADDPKTGRAKIRLVDIHSARYAIARRYMIRLRRDDFENPAELAKFAVTAGITVDEFKKQFEHLVETEPPPLVLVPKK